MTDKDTSEWLRITGQRYDSMKRRFGPKYDKRGRCRRPGAPLPFSLDEFRRFILDLFPDQNWHSTVKCSYYAAWNIGCEGELHILNLQLDHRFPVARGGTLDLSNLAPCCANCNNAKGSLSHGAFLGLVQFCGQIPFPDRQDLMGRLQRSTRFIQGRAHSRRKSQESVRLSPIRRLR
jgi:hypothetical protein